MSCEIEQFADCGDISSLGRALFVPEKEDVNWLTQCPMSLSSCGNLLAVGYKNRMCLLTTQWISSTESNTYIISWSGTLPADISVILTLPICPSKQSSQNGPDWFCVIVGFKNGSVGFYTNTGHLLLLEKLEDMPVMKISCNTGTYGILPDDINILFETCECMIAGTSLYQTLKNAKAQLARVKAGVLDEYTIDSRSINIRKWTFTSDQETLNDAEVLGSEIKNTYDHLLAASTYGGYDTWYRSVPPICTLILGAGVKPYVGFHYALEGGNAPALQDVAKAVANKIKSALPGWLGGGNNENAPTNTEPVLRSESLYMRHGLYDSQRQGTTVVVSQDRRLAAITDNFGRVAVLDVKKGYLIRLFKGCRDAQCAFIQIFDSDNKKPHQCVAMDYQRAIFLIIYNPKKGLIDIRLMQTGNRVAVFTATKNGQLLYNTCGLVGTEKNYTHKKLNLPDFQCVLIDPDGKLKKFNIPFFFALEGEDSQKSKDLHLLRELRTHIKKEPENMEEYFDEIVKRASEIKTLELKKYCIDLLLRKCNIPPKLMMTCLETYWNSIVDDTSTEGDDIRNYFTNIALTTLFYIKINNEDTTDLKEFIAKITDDHNEEEQADILKDEEEKSEFHLLEDDTCILEKMLHLAQETNYVAHQRTKVTFADNNENNFKEYLSCFVLDGKSKLISLKSDASEEKLNNVASIIFKAIFGMNDFKLLTQFVRMSSIDPKDIVKLIIMHFMNMPLEQINIDLIEKAIAVLYYVCLVSEDAENISYNEISSWWQDIRWMLAEMPCSFRGMIAAMACKAVGRRFEINCSEDEAWESVTKERAVWGLLIGKLEDIAILSIVLLFKEDFKGNTLPKLTFEDLNINLKFIHTRGQGSITELIAKWLCSMGVSPEAILVNELMEERRAANEPLPDEFDEEETTDDDPNYVFFVNNRQYVDDNPAIFKWLSLLCRHFPLSTKSAYIIANMCWEYAMAWQKNMQKLTELNAIFPCFNYLKDVHIKRGLFTIIWSTYIKNLFETTCRLVHKVGRMPKDPLCLQDLGFNAENMLNFLEFTTEYLGKFYTCYTTPTDQKKTEIKYEKIWNETTPSLVEVAQDTKPVDVDILNLNYQISCTIYSQCHFDLKLSKPLDALFDIDYQYIFDAFTGNVPAREISLIACEKLSIPRHKFLARLTRASVETITRLETEESHISERLDCQECLKWIPRIITLSKLWNIGDDFIYQEEVIGLYFRGYDRMTLSTLRSVGETEKVQPPLLAMSIQRMKRALQRSSNPNEFIANLSPQLYTRLRSTPLDEMISPDSSLRTTATVLRTLVNSARKRPPVYQNERDNRLTELIIENCDILVNKKLCI